MNETSITKNQQVEESELTSQNAKDLNQQTQDELGFDEVIKKWERNSIKEYSIPADLEEPPFEVIECIVKTGYSHVTIVDASLKYVEMMCNHFHHYHMGDISFTFYLGSYYPKVLKYWEPEKPNFWKIMEAIKLANAYGFKVKVNCFPLDLDTYVLVKTLTPFVDEIYIDIVCDIKDLVFDADQNDYGKVIKANELIDSQTDDWVLSLVEKLNNIPIITWGGYIDRIRRSNMFLG